MVNRVILIVVACAALCAAPGHKVSVIAHRGEYLSHPENTLAAFQAAIDLRADYIELDVRTTRDGKSVLMHDNRVDRTTNGKGEVEKMSFDEIRSLEVKGGGKVPTFDEALSLAKGRIGVYVDAKRVAPTDLVDALERHDMIEHSVIYGNWTFLKQVFALNGKARVMPEAGSPAHLRQVLSEGHPPVVAFDTRDFTSETIALARNAKALVFVDCLGPADNPASWENAFRRAPAAGSRSRLRRRFPYQRHIEPNRRASAYRPTRRLPDVRVQQSHRRGDT